MRKLFFNLTLNLISANVLVFFLIRTFFPASNALISAILQTVFFPIIVSFLFVIFRYNLRSIKVIVVKVFLVSFIFWSTFFALIINVERSRSVLVLGLVSAANESEVIVDETLLNCLALKIDESPSGFKQRVEEQLSLRTLLDSNETISLSVFGRSLFKAFKVSANLFNLNYFNSNLTIFDSLLASNECQSK
jgi:hypothetical protein